MLAQYYARRTDSLLLDVVSDWFRELLDEQNTQLEHRYCSHFGGLDGAVNAEQDDLPPVERRHCSAGPTLYSTEPAV